MIQLNHVTKSNGAFVLQDISLTINNETIFGIVGESGSGKSTLLSILNLTQTIDSGELIIDGKPCHQLTQKQRNKMKQSIGMIFQDYHLLSNLTALDNVHLPLKLKGVKEKEQATYWLERVGLIDHLESYPSQLSGGQRQRVALARALVINPSIVLLDEATSALDEFNAHLILSILKKVHEERDITIIFVSHDLDKVKNFCDECLILDNGQQYDVVKIMQDSIEQENSSYPLRAVSRLTK